MAGQRLAHGDVAKLLGAEFLYDIRLVVEPRDARFADYPQVVAVVGDEREYGLYGVGVHARETYVVSQHILRGGLLQSAADGGYIYPAVLRGAALHHLTAEERCGNVVKMSRDVELHLAVVAETVAEGDEAGV